MFDEQFALPLVSFHSLTVDRILFSNTVGFNLVISLEIPFLTFISLPYYLFLKYLAQLPIQTFYSFVQNCLIS